MKSTCSVDCWWHVIIFNKTGNVPKESNLHLWLILRDYCNHISNYPEKMHIVIYQLGTRTIQIELHPFRLQQKVRFQIIQSLLSGNGICFESKLSEYFGNVSVSINYLSYFVNFYWLTIWFPSGNAKKKKCTHHFAFPLSWIKC